jgi:hypothetical protein
MTAGDENDRPRFAQGGVVYRSEPGDDRIPFPLSMCLNSRPPSGQTARPCDDCERCTWNPGPDCEKRDHPHCLRCGHCLGRHADQSEDLERFSTPSARDSVPALLSPGISVLPHGACPTCGHPLVRFEPGGVEHLIAATGFAEGEGERVWAEIVAAHGGEGNVDDA